MLECKNICKKYYDRGADRIFTVLDNVSLQIAPNEAVGIMGKSGSGKSTLARILLRLVEADSGKIYFEGQDITHLKNAQLKNFRRQVQFISQRPESFLDPMMCLGQSLSEPLKVHGIAYDTARVEKLLDLVQLNSTILQRYPHQVSGGEIQRICIARALLLKPKLLVLDEPTSMLDISVQAQILHLLKDIRKSQNIAYFFITHDKKIAHWFCDKLLYMENGRCYSNILI